MKGARLGGGSAATNAEDGAAVLQSTNPGVRGSAAGSGEQRSPGDASTYWSAASRGSRQPRGFLAVHSNIFDTILVYPGFLAV
ncbi:hypothetical protein [Halobacteriaceae bacterium SHR40]|uniref:hypothetical protein n=1 Tax=Halovenus amylolytica TaxID=2500550 RepID=UPI000FE43F68